MNEPTDAPLDAWLRRCLDEQPPDDGFTARVMRALPPRRSRWPLPLALLAGSLLAWLALSPAPLWEQATRQWLSLELGGSALWVCALLLGIGLLSCAWALEEG